MENNSEFFTKKQLAERWQISEWTLWSLRRQGVLPPALRIGKSLRWNRGDIEKWEAGQTRPAEAFDPEFCRRAEKAAEARGVVRVEEIEKPCRRGRKTIAQKVAERTGGKS